MKIKFEDSFWNRFLNQLDYIAGYSPTAARKLNKEITQAIKKIPKNPYQYRKSIYFDNFLYRDLIHKGYTVTFRIDEKEKKIIVFGFTRYQQFVTD